MTITRGDIFYVTDDPKKPSVGSEIWANRMGLVISNNVLNRSSRAVEIVYLSTSPHKKPSPTHTPVTSGTKTATAMCEQIHTVDKSRLKDYIGKAKPDEMDNVDAAILFSVQINTGKNPQGIFKKFQKMLETYPEKIDFE